MINWCLSHLILARQLTLARGGYDALAGGARYIAEWQRCLAVVRPDLTRDDLEVLANAVLTTIGDLTLPGETDGQNVEAEISVRVPGSRS